VALLAAGEWLVVRRMASEKRVYAWLAGNPGRPLIEVVCSLYILHTTIIQNGRVDPAAVREQTSPRFALLCACNGQRVRQVFLQTGS